MNSVFSPPSPAASSSSSSHSSITTHSFASSTDSSLSVAPSSSHYLSPSSSPTRCQGLNLLVKAIHHVTAGSVVGVPYIQRRVIRRRRAAMRFNNLIITEVFREQRGGGGKETKTKREKRAMALPSKYQDSVLQPWKTRSRRHRSMKIGEETGSQAQPEILVIFGFGISIGLRSLDMGFRSMKFDHHYWSDQAVGAREASFETRGKINGQEEDRTMALSSKYQESQPAA
ncbi:hypothetical protein RJ639_029525 [Escallonia herrerae]|uniref:Uncharacterized protein n=1 Tax=Escallonia herrerae TaxID=1293975 RepID=A0AA88TZW4_9ASTE|nr:hypothetical protein RJ639_029525 [Escallonia herrerae]